MRRVFFTAIIFVMILTCSAFGADIISRAKRGDIDAQYELAHMYFSGSGVKQSYKKARAWFIKAASRGHLQAQVVLGLMYEGGIGGNQDYKIAHEWYFKAAVLGNGDAFACLGTMYCRGSGVKIDYKKAFDYWSKGAELGHAGSMCMLGYLYNNGLYVKADSSEAFKWYKISAEKNNPYAMLNLGYCYENGIGTSKDIYKAVDLYRQAAARGLEEAKEQLARLNSSGNIHAGNNIYDLKTKTTTEKVITESRKKPTIAIHAFEDKSEEGNAPERAIIDMMTTELFNAGDFDLVERERLSHVTDEIKLGQSGMMKPSTAPKIGQIIGAQYSLTGAITLYYYSEKASGFAIPVLGTSAKAKTAYVVLDIRIIDITTSRIVYAASKTGEAKQVSKSSTGNREKMIGGLLSQATRDAVIKHISAMRTAFL